MADPDVDLFAGMKKKKKKQVALDVGDSPSAPSDAPDSPAPAVAEEAPTPAPITKKGDKFGNEDPEEEAPAPVADEGAELFGDLKKKKKKKKEIPLDLVCHATDVF